MQVVAVAVRRFDEWRSWYFEWSRAPGLLKKLALTFGVAALTGLLAQVYVPLPFTPVPLTGQVLGALLAGTLLGGAFGAASMGIYVLLGVLAIPWFAGGHGSLAYFLGPTGGYLIGFIAAAYFIGMLNERFKWSGRFLAQLCIACAGLLLIYAFGAAWLAVVYRIGLPKAIVLGVIPFLGVDAIKVLLAAGSGALLLPRR